MPSEKIRVSDELYQKLKDISENLCKKPETCRSIRSLVEEAVRIFVLGFSGDKSVDKVRQGWITVEYPARCVKCGRDVKQGEKAYWIKHIYTDGTSRSMVICENCFFTEEAVAEKYIKKRELEAVIRGLEKKAGQLADEVIKLRAMFDAYQLRKEIYAEWSRFRTSIHSPLNWASNEVRELLSSIVKKLDEILERQARIEEKVDAYIAGKSLSNRVGNIIKRGGVHVPPQG